MFIFTIVVYKHSSTTNVNIFAKVRVADMLGDSILYQPQALSSSLLQSFLREHRSA